MAGRQKTANTPTRYAGLQVQTSALGVVIPQGWGTYRTKANVIWYGNFQSKATKAAAAGKGGATTTGYTYHADVILAICEGPINAITTVWKDATALTTLSAAGLSVSLGAIGQPVWGYLATHDPAQALGYSGLVIAYAANYALDSSANLPSHAFEIQTLTRVAGLPDANPADILTDWLTNGRYGVPGWPAGALADWSSYRTYCLAANLLLSPVIDSERSAADFLREILQASNADCVWSEGVLKIVPYGDTSVSGNGASWSPNLVPVYALDDDSYQVKSDGDDPITVDLQDQSDAYNIVQIDYLSRTNAYNSGLKVAQDSANISEYGRRKQNPTSLHCICDDQVAMNVAQLVLQRTLYIRRQFKFNLPWTYDLLEPMDLVEVSDAVLGLSAYPVRITQIDEDEDGVLAIIAEDVLAGVSHAPIYAHQDVAGFVPNQAIDPGGVEANLLLWSQDQTNAVWSKTNLTVTAEATTDSYGGSSADALVTTTVAGPHSTAQAFTGFSGLAYTFAAYVKPAGRKIARLQLASTTSSANVLVEVDVSTGILTTPATAAGGASGAVATVAPAANGFWRVSITGILAADTALQAVVWTLNDAGADSYAGDGSSGLYVWGAQLKQGVDVPLYAATTSVIAGPMLFNPPAVLTSGGAETWAAVSGGADWGGCHVWTSIDGDTYQQVGTIQGGARYGVTTSALAADADPDTVDTVGVDLGASAGALMAASNAAADASSTLCLIDQELIAFSSATLTNPSRYALASYLRRGVLGTPITTHAAGAPFVRLDGATFALPYLATQQAKTVYVKFQSFNAWGAAVQGLENCNVYSIAPFPQGSTAPGASAWTAIGTTISNGGVSIAAIQITGASDNPSASGVVFYYRLHGTTTWSSAGLHPNTTTLYDITSVGSGGYYDVGVAYLVNGVVGALSVIAINIQAGAAATGGGSGSVLFDTSAAGSGSYAFASSYAGGHALIELWGADGGDALEYYSLEYAGPAYTFPAGLGGSGGYCAISIAVTPGTTSVSYSLGAGGTNQIGAGTAGTGSTVSSPALSAGGGGGAPGTGPIYTASGGAASGGTTNTPGAAGRGGQSGTGGIESVGSTAANGRIRITAQS